VKRVTITFDYEGSWGMPHNTPYDLAAVTRGLLDVLARHNARAVFFVTGKLVEEHPEVIAEIHARGHEIGCHGYLHEHMHELNATQLKNLTAKLRSTNRRLEALVGYSPRGFRAPYLMGPKFYDQLVYQALAKNGFTWVSNREVRRPEELFRPGRLGHGGGLLKFNWLRKMLTLALNLHLILTETPERGRWLISSTAWLWRGQQPFVRPEGLVEYPLYSPLDCDLLGFPPPQIESGSRSVAYTINVLRHCYDQSGSYFNINVHDWIIGTADRLQILDEVLGYIEGQQESQYFLPGLAEETV